MAKRFVSTDIWQEDWFLDMPNEYKLFWYYLISNCDHAGLFKVNLRIFNALNGVNLDSKKAIEYYNNGKQRIRIVLENLWLIEDFFMYQYGETFNANNRVHESIEKLYNKHGIKMTSIRGLKDLKDRVKDKDKDKDKNKGGTGGILRGEKFNDEKTGVIFPDGSTQVLGKDQLALVDMGYCKPRDIVKGLIN
jgi:hypothetical protein